VALIPQFEAVTTFGSLPFRGPLTALRDRICDLDQERWDDRPRVLALVQTTPSGPYRLTAEPLLNWLYVLRALLPDLRVVVFSDLAEDQLFQANLSRAHHLLRQRLAPGANPLSLALAAWADEDARVEEWGRANPDLPDVLSLLPTDPCLAVVPPPCGPAATERGRVLAMRDALLRRIGLFRFRPLLLRPTELATGRCPFHLAVTWPPPHRTLPDAATPYPSPDLDWLERVQVPLAFVGPGAEAALAPLPHHLSIPLTVDELEDPLQATSALDWLLVALRGLLRQRRRDRPTLITLRLHPPGGRRRTWDADIRVGSTGPRQSGRISSRRARAVSELVDGSVAPEAPELARQATDALLGECGPVLLTALGTLREAGVPADLGVVTPGVCADLAGFEYLADERGRPLFAVPSPLHTLVRVLPRPGAPIPQTLPPLHGPLGVLLLRGASGDPAERRRYRFELDHVQAGLRMAHRARSTTRGTVWEWPGDQDPLAALRTIRRSKVLHVAAPGGRAEDGTYVLRLRPQAVSLRDLLASVPRNRPLDMLVLAADRSLRALSDPQVRAALHNCRVRYVLLLQESADPDAWPEFLVRWYRALEENVHPVEACALARHAVYERHGGRGAWAAPVLVVLPPTGDRPPSSSGGSPACTSCR